MLYSIHTHTYISLNVLFGFYLEMCKRRGVRQIPLPYSHSDVSPGSASNKINRLTPRPLQLEAILNSCRILGRMVVHCQARSININIILSFPTLTVRLDGGTWSSL